MNACTAAGSRRARCSPLKRATAWLNPKSSRPVKETAATSATQSPNRAGPSMRSTTGVVTAVATTPAASAANPLRAPAPIRGAFRSGADADALAKEGGKAFNHKLQHWFGEARIDADEKCVAHHPVGLGQFAEDTHRRIQVGGLPQDVSAEDIAGLDVRVLQPLDQGATRHPAPNRDRKTKPGGFGPVVPAGQDQAVLEPPQPAVQRLEVPTAPADEVVEPFELRDTDRRLQIGRLEVVADVGVGVLM